ncbi:glycosyl hydrolase family 88 [Paenibacillus marchantiophytorum]|uniref:Glycosyl hydrolase family 88 n=1 Tax=Paenibacillus marchantiophytorum TaxID=1619310 RepID=A0ABQ1F7L1_9BACL|nr:glycoside hydrolase family 88 protein [Paenibacillus marchantiophytorum]GGA01030.1 glycosyl hydrolase family 88 [Paenibacillus marchantiophytorum]
MANFTGMQEEPWSGWWSQLQTKVDRMMEQMGDKCPHASVSGVYDDVILDWWTSGFWPGMMWILYDMTGKESYRQVAWSWDERIEQCFLRENRFHHDVGFQFLSTAVIKYKLTGDADARRRGLQAANLLAGRFNLAGGFLRAQNQADRPGGSIIDTMMNLSILFWASQESGDPRFAHIARAHADTVLRHTLREDGSSHHITVFDANTGDVMDYLGGQGYSPTSSWSRGQAWALYGMANTYKYTGDSKYLDAAKRTANYYLSCLPDDYVAYWDFRVPDVTVEPRDTSAASIGASGLLAIAEQLPSEEGKVYRKAAESIMHSLSQNYSTLDQPEFEGILLEATGNKPVNKDVNVSLIYGDYYYLEAMAKLMGWDNDIF